MGILYNRYGNIQRPDLLTSTQKNVANWVATAPGITLGYLHEVSGTRINWDIHWISGGGTRNSGYYIELPISQIPAGNYVFEVRYRITDLGYHDTGCRIGIASAKGIPTLNDSYICRVDILDTQTTYTTVSVPYTRSANQNAYLAISNTNYNITYSNAGWSGRIYLDSISLRAV